MFKTLILVFLFPFVLVAAVVVSPLALLYFLFSRLCDLIESFRPAKGRKTGKELGRAARLSQLLNIIPLANHHNRRPASAAEPAL